MKYLVLLADGMADLPIPRLQNRTPLDAAKTPNLDRLASDGELGLVRTTPAGATPTSEITNLTIFGYDAKKYPQFGRSPLEAASLGVSVGKDDVVFRCNLVTLKDEQRGYDIERLGPHVILEDPSAGHISSDDSRALIEELNSQLATEFLQFYAGVSYRHLMVWIGGRARGSCTPPYDLAGKPVVGGLPTGDGSDMLRKVMESAVAVLTLHPLNVERVDQGLKPANGVWLWGQGKAAELTPFAERFGKRGALIAAVDVMKGLALAVGFDVIHVPGATGYLDTDYQGKVDAAVAALNTHDLVVLHVEAPDEASHNGDLDAKLRAIEDFDAKVVGPVIQATASEPALRVLALCDHVAPVSTRSHTPDPVPYLLHQRGGAAPAPSGARGFHEAAAKASGKLVADGHRLMEHFLKG
ncbi:MAG TPA: cofactor-independent phosphoglycerate mutase [Nitrospiria bacterium]|nr:cofactor-independent phosphoglycerate mutase [Nitrospiria bacterium]